MRILNSEDPEQRCAIGFISVQGLEARSLAEWLWEKKRIRAVAVETKGEYSGLRITPNVYPTLEEIDTFAETMERILKAGQLPA